ncbi:hypothetical protein RND71_041925 [Anisodus tanguticus]|uniref:Pentatricopeptide repeat-containing protein n=1 Tax=Anisodus tanguticus TaxID=243964 RepID=A0AAE1UQ83_9SOLA|nr:hypothetical protein RND71_041925 [Anisodus tanguticus]
MKMGRVKDADKLFEKIPERNVVIWIEGFNTWSISHGLIVKLGLEDNSFICVAMESKCLCESVHALVVKLGLVFDVQVNNSFLFLYSSLMELASSRKIFNTMSLLVHLEYASDAIKLFFHMRDYDHLILMNLISACGVLGNLKMGKSVHAQVITHGFGTELPLLNAMITMYARSVFDRSTMKSMVSWTSIISGLLHNGRPKGALDMFIHVRIEENFFTDSVLLVSALTAAGEMCGDVTRKGSQVGVAVERETARLLHQSGVYPVRTRESSGCGFLRQQKKKKKWGDVELANNVFVQMASLRDIVSWNAIINGIGYLPDVIKFLDGEGETLWKAMLNGCACNSDLKLAEFAARKFHEQIQKDPGQLLLLSYLYASVGRFKDAEEVQLGDGEID